MSDPAKEKAVWTLWGLTTLVTLGMSAAARLVAHLVYHCLHDNELREWPILTLPALGLATHLWAVAIVMAVAAAVIMVKNGAEAGPLAIFYQWAAFAAACAFIAIGLLVPFDYLCRHLGTWYVP